MSTNPLQSVAQEADTLSQNLIPFLAEHAETDQWAKDLLQQVRALGENARKALASQS